LQQKSLNFRAFLNFSSIECHFFLEVKINRHGPLILNHIQYDSKFHSVYINSAGSVGSSGSDSASKFHSVYINSIPRPNIKTLRNSSKFHSVYINSFQRSAGSIAKRVSKFHSVYINRAILGDNNRDYEAQNSILFILIAFCAAFIYHVISLKIPFCLY